MRGCGIPRGFWHKPGGSVDRVEGIIIETFVILCQYNSQIHRVPAHSGGNDRFCARLKTDISASYSGLRGRTRSCLTFLERGRPDESKMGRHDLR
jgi:hypothetical protein